MKKNRKFVVPLFLIICLSLSITVPQAVAQDSQVLKIGVSIAPLAGMVRAVGGPYAETFIILPEGVEPHASQLPTEAVIEAEDADLLVFTGHFPWEEDLASQVNVPFITLDDENAMENYHDFGAELSQFPGEDSHDHNTAQDEHDHDGNPHAWWLLPKNAIAIANATRAALTSLNSTFTDFWADSFDEFVKDVDALKALVASQDDTYHFSDMSAVVVFPAEAYVAEAFGIEVIAYLQEGSVQISGNQLLEVQNALRNGSVNLILGSDVARLQAAGEFAEQLQQDYGGELIWLRAVFFSGLSDYISVMTYNIGALVSGLETGSVLSVYGSDLVWMGATGVLAVIVVLETVLLVKQVRSERRS